LQVSTTRRSTTAGLAGWAEESIEDVTEAAEGPKALEAAVTKRALEAGVTEAGVAGTALRVGEHLIGLVDFLEASFGTLLGVAVRVVLHGKAPESALDLVCAGVALNAEGFVVVGLLCSHA